MNQYDLIVLDDILPGKRGGEICTELRRRGQATPVLFISVRAGTEEKVHSLNLGADDYLAKPFSYTELSARIRALLRRPQVFQASELRVDDLVFNESSAIARRGDREIYLTTKESALLRYLMINAGMLVTRAMIFEHVWDEETDPLSNMIETHVYNLRQKIDEPGMTKMIKTVSGRGYILFQKGPRDS
jgi:DNA-binding response OmpR family regulator